VYVFIDSEFDETTATQCSVLHQTRRKPQHA